MFDWLTGFVDRTGYLGIALLMFAENLFPPIPSELVMPLGGFAAARGDLSALGVLLAGTVGSIAGALFWYGVGCLVGAERLKAWAARHGRWLTLSPKEVDRVERWFDRHCGKVVLLGRLLPTIRTLISVPAGMFDMGLKRFLIFSTVGTAMWNMLLMGAGYALEARYHDVAAYLNPVTTGILVLLLGFYLYRVATWRPRR